MKVLNRLIAWITGREEIIWISPDSWANIPVMLGTKWVPVVGIYNVTEIGNYIIHDTPIRVYKHKNGLIGMSVEDFDKAYAKREEQKQSL